MKVAKEITSRSECPVSYTLDFFGDRWTLLILRDMIFSGKSTYGQFLQSEEKIATNILADRLSMLETNGFVTKNAYPENRSRFIYQLTEKGISLLPIIIEMNIWGAKSDSFEGNKELLSLLKKDKEKTIKELTKMLKKRTITR
jgi:DNA-binding HxlR family transcriptional regulator